MSVAQHAMDSFFVKVMKGLPDNFFGSKHIMHPVFKFNCILLLIGRLF